MSCQKRGMPPSRRPDAHASKGAACAFTGAVPEGTVAAHGRPAAARSAPCLWRNAQTPRPEMPSLPAPKADIRRPPPLRNRAAAVRRRFREADAAARGGGQRAVHTGRSGRRRQEPAVRLQGRRRRRGGRGRADGPGKLGGPCVRCMEQQGAVCRQGEHARRAAKAGDILAHGRRHCQPPAGHHSRRRQGHSRAAGGQAPAAGRRTVVHAQPP